jgi:hypothetical protein
MNLDPNNEFTSLVFKNGGEANWYSTNRGGGGLWQGASVAWEELYASYERAGSKIECNTYQGRMLEWKNHTTI